MINKRDWLILIGSYSTGFFYPGAGNTKS